MPSGQNPFDLVGRRGLITGGTQGVGAAIATEMARAGADVLLAGLHHDDVAQQTLEACRAHGVAAELVTVDLAQPPANYLDHFLAQVDQAMPGSICWLITRAPISILRFLNWITSASQRRCI